MFIQTINTKGSDQINFFCVPYENSKTYYSLYYSTFIIDYFVYAKTISQCKQYDCVFWCKNSQFKKCKHFSCFTK